jgi:4,5-dihydroxyphthalate decarboxylase
MRIGDINNHLFSGPQQIDIAEVGLQPFMIAYANDNFRDYTLLPVFPFRTFRHRSIFIRTDRGIKSPLDLKGKTIGTPGYSSTSLTWIRGFLQEQYGVKPQDLTWVISSGDSSKKLAGRTSKNEQVRPDGVIFKSGTAGLDESELLESGEVDVLLHAVEPMAYIKGNPNVARLFPDYRKVERAYYAKTGVFPIMHALAIKTSLLKKYPWLAQNIFEAYSKSKMIAYKEMKQAWYNDMLPWYGQELAETQRLMGNNFYSYGLELNRKTLELLFKYSHQQGLTKRDLSVEELFDPLANNLKESIKFE